MPFTACSLTCVQVHINPYLTTIADPIPLLQIFANQYRDGTLAPSKNTVHSRTMEGALQAIGQMFSTLGQDNPRLLPSGKLDLRLS
jgi:hypothetical protein